MKQPVFAERVASGMPRRFAEGKAKAFPDLAMTDVRFAPNHPIFLRKTVEKFSGVFR